MQGPTNEPLRPLPPGGPPQSGGVLQNILRNPLAIVGIALVVLLLLACICIAVLGNSLSGMLSGISTQQPGLAPIPTAVLLPGQQGQPGTSAQIDQVVLAQQITADRKPVQAVTTFPANTNTIYATYHITSINAGDQIYARWIYNGNVLTESDDITAPQAYTDRWGEFHISPRQGATFSPGQYQVQIIVNGITAGSTNFTVQ